MHMEEDQRKKKSMLIKPTCFSVVAHALCTIYMVLSHVLIISEAQTTNTTTDPSEVRALNSIFQKWGIKATSNWNISGEPCSGYATDNTNLDNNGVFNPGIKCDCSYNNSAICHITHLKVYALEVVGTIVEELMNLTYLSNLDLRQNYFTGPLPKFIGNFTQMQYMSVGINALSGELPKELGNLTNLIVLSISSNNFNGTLPPELGNLVNLEQLYFDSSGLSGTIPSTFVKLQSLLTVWASDNALTGKIPDFIGTNWLNLTSLRLQGNSFEGPIPSSFSNLTSMTDLRISEISNGSSSLAFIKNMTALSVLILRNNNISDTIPSNITVYQSLQQLDLSFNNLTGKIPSSLFTLSSLSYLFLGNNQLFGTLPSQKSSSLLSIDLSYNQLSGILPLWVTEGRLQVNLIANNFNISGSNISGLPSGLKCLQRNFPCNRGSPLYYNFSIKCGGPEIKSSAGIVFERENETLGTATYFVTETERWAVSNTGKFNDKSDDDTYTVSSYAQFGNTFDPDLFQTARISPGSLRYYGLGLQNGIYNVTLLFSDITLSNVFANIHNWGNLGRRVFDIYIQGNLWLQDFDIRKEAGGISFKAVQKETQAQVSENFLEIHFFWAGKGTCCVPEQGTYGPSISAISAVRNSVPTVGNTPHTGLIVGIAVPIGVVSFLFFSVVYYILQRRKGKGKGKGLNIDEDAEFLVIGSRPNTFSYAELRTATDEFNSANKLGVGGFGPVYKGTLPDQRVVAVKQLSVASHQGNRQFITEIATISAVQHRNLVKLYGCCIEGDRRLLVYEYLENKSLDQALFGRSGLHLNWPTRYDICLGTARGLAYLHEDSKPRIVHRDVKASNILLDADLNPKISDFGLAKLYDDKMTHISTRVAGTIGYLAPEYAMRGHLTEKADVFGFGVVVLEVISGRPISDTSLSEEKVYLLEWAWNLHESNRELELVDPALSEYNDVEARRMIGVGLLCTQALPSLRPAMSRVVAMLSGDTEVSTAKTKPGYINDWEFNGISRFMSGDTSGTSTSGNPKSQTRSLNLTAVVDGDHFPATADQPMLHQSEGDIHLSNLSDI
ncbi:probable LRR receptor-like serine/threonine-protein kinase At1g56140 [Macadamia integrifolia]|uniref:probable LRR receptor-like serine/threonine-protein kinase At1g56140 n=1 Tax=Macadamia integrifolia TaxID=60698 RepID=UPI001C52F3C3|nr:probable LRR receptor-like serine/threonine-protein kinase At1g56140 [Macadamia integrifolia]